MPPFEVKEIKAKSILTPSKLPDADYVINPYIGCRFGCIYCYASFMGRFVDKSTKDWGEYVFAKVNAAELLAGDLTKLKNKGKGKTVLLSSVTDPYQGMETKYQLTRKCLEVLADFRFEGTVGILTKSDLVLRDIDVLKKIKNVEVGLTITSTDDSVSRFFEKYAPPVSTRITTLQKLRQAGLSTYVFVGPLLPHYVAEEKKLDELFSSIAQTGNKDLYIEHINLSAYILNRLLEELGKMNQQVLSQFYQSQDKAYRHQLDAIVGKLIKKYDFNLRLSSTIFHKENGKTKNETYDRKN